MIAVTPAVGVSPRSRGMVVGDGGGDSEAARRAHRRGRLDAIAARPRRWRRPDRPGVGLKVATISVLSQSR